MIVDTDSKQNIISSRLYRALLKSYKLQGKKKTFIAYGQRKPLNCLGYFCATLRSGNNYINGRINVIESEAESLLGRESSLELEVIKLIKMSRNGDLNNSTMNDTMENDLDALVNEISDIIQSIQAMLRVMSIKLKLIQM